MNRTTSVEQYLDETHRDLGVSPGDGQTMTVEQYQEELRRTQAATAKVEGLLANKALWEDLQVKALELSDATDDLNDVFTKAVESLRALRIRPGWVPLSDGRAVIWDGKELLYDNGKESMRVLNTGRRVRLEAAAVMPLLAAELMRPRGV